jgi:hypothetical protein
LPFASIFANGANHVGGRALVGAVQVRLQVGKRPAHLPVHRRAGQGKPRPIRVPEGEVLLAALIDENHQRQLGRKTAEELFRLLPANRADAALEQDRHLLRAGLALEDLVDGQDHRRPRRIERLDTRGDDGGRFVDHLAQRRQADDDREADGRQEEHQANSQEHGSPHGFLPGAWKSVRAMESA